MAVTLDRDPAFWGRIATHPQVSPTIGPFDAQLVRNPVVSPLRSAHGGWLFVQMDALGRVFDLHAMFTPEGWGREASNALRECLRHHVQTWQLVTVFELERLPSSRAPRSFGFRPAGPFAGGVRTAFLTREAWERSPASRRTE